MQSDLGTIAMVFICLGSIVATVKLLVHGKIWNKIIENNLLRDNLNMPNLSTLAFDKLAWMRWGIVIISFSLSLILISFIPEHIADELKIGISGIFIGTAFIISYFITEKMSRK